MFLQKLVVYSSDGLFGVEYGGKIEGNAYMDVC
jgi:hypothetical protein